MIEEMQQNGCHGGNSFQSNLLLEGRSRSVIRSCGCDQKGRRLSWETGVEEVGSEVFPA